MAIVLLNTFVLVSVSNYHCLKVPSISTVLIYSVPVSPIHLASAVLLNYVILIVLDAT